ncbi:MAG: tetratricopeptide repeat protein, partial [Opitutus sp.]|nr:tetratricopeptide repeat protein [Opitutus sp.]
MGRHDREAAGQLPRPCQLRAGAFAPWPGRPAEALPAFQRALALDPASAATELNLGTTFFEFRDFSSAATHFRRTLTLNPRDANAHSGLGATRFELRDATGALELYRAALALDPEHIAAHTNAGRALFALGRFAEAVAHYERVLAHSPASPAAPYRSRARARARRRSASRHTALRGGAAAQTRSGRVSQLRAFSFVGGPARRGARERRSRAPASPRFSRGAGRAGLPILGGFAARPRQMGSARSVATRLPQVAVGAVAMPHRLRDLWLA